MYEQCDALSALAPEKTPSEASPCRPMLVSCTSTGYIDILIIQAPADYSFYVAHTIRLKVMSEFIHKPLQIKGTWYADSMQRCLTVCVCVSVQEVGGI